MNERRNQYGMISFFIKHDDEIIIEKFKKYIRNDPTLKDAKDGKIGPAMIRLIEAYVKKEELMNGPINIKDELESSEEPEKGDEKDAS